jgi:hypothetical protein
MASQQVPADSVLTRTTFFVVKKGYFGEHKTASLAGVQTDADKNRLSLGKRIVQMPETALIRSCDGRFRIWLNKNCTPFAEGTWNVSYGMVTAVAQRAQEWKDERALLVAAAGRAYPAEVEKQRREAKAGTGLAHLYDPRDYPSAERFMSEYWAEDRFIDFGVPGALMQVDPAIFEAERQKLVAEGERAKNLIQQHLAQQVIDITEHLHELLTPRSSGRKAAVRDGTLDDLFQFLDTLAARDVTGFAELQTITERLRQTAAGLDVETLRKDDTVRTRTASVMGEVRDAVAALIVDAPARGIRVRDDDESEVA